MFGFFGRAKRAKTVAVSIGQLIHMLSAGRETLGPESPVLRGLSSSDVAEAMRGDTRRVTALVPMTADQTMVVSLTLPPDGSQVLGIDGNDDYAGFHLSCGLPWGAVMIGLQPSLLRPVTKQARLLYAECKTMPGAIEMLLPEDRGIVF